MTINLDTLRKIAEAEESHKYGSWALSEDDWDGFCVYTNDGEPGIAYVAKGMHQGVSEGESTARFIAMFDPPTVLALLTRLEQAEQAVARVRELGDAWKSRGEHDMEYSKTIPQDVGEIIFEGGAEMVNKANLIFRALDGDQA